MGFSNSGVYTAPTGAINQTPGAVIRSATWNTIFVDITSALTLVGQQLWNGPKTLTANYTVLTTDTALIFNASGTTTVTLPSAATVQGHYLTLKTVAAQAVVASATVVAPLTATTPGTAILAATAGKFARLQSDGANWIVMMAN